MGQRHTPEVIEVLLTTLRKLEQSHPNDPVVLELKGHILRTIAELKRVKTEKAMAA